jgi:Flp pilus assembly protein TadG
VRAFPKSSPHIGELHRGQALVEFAFILPIVLILTLGLIDLGRAFVFGISVQEGARQAARLAASANYDATVDDSAITGRLIASSSPALVGCPLTPNTTVTCNGGTWRYSIDINNGTYTSISTARTALTPSNAFSGASVRVTATGSIALLPGFQTGAFGLSLPQIGVQGQAAMVVL